ncbi:hypothetical protein QJS10_CPB12g00831 [Acorus calamus]|uniref:Uncharacterized protein n=1 Tax=Acorus calamus TaxID=4465 RepID=A0AAV9DJW3_ACOCL|nr:hypothetical protein QJS10_CPB12g00831 [Acorus calamus]
MGGKVIRGRFQILHSHHRLGTTYVMVCLLFGNILGSSQVYVITDGSVDQLSRAAAAAYVLVQDRPVKILGAGMSSWPWSSPLIMEAEAISKGLQAAYYIGASNIVVLFLKVSREDVRAPEVLARQARSTQHTKWTQFLEDDMLRVSLQPQLLVEEDIPDWAGPKDSTTRLTFEQDKLVDEQGHLHPEEAMITANDMSRIPGHLMEKFKTD